MMSKDLTTSRLDRQNILNNDLAVEEIQESVEIKSVPWNERLYLTKELAAAFFNVDIRTIERYISNFSDELKANGMEILKGKKLESFIRAYDDTFATDINVGHKIRSMTAFDFRAFLHMAILLSESEKARALRQLMLDIVIDLINRKTGGGTKYINQRDRDYVFSSDIWLLPKRSFQLWKISAIRRQQERSIKNCSIASLLLSWMEHTKWMKSSSLTLFMQ